MICFKCSTENPVVVLVGRGDNCLKCGFSLRVCRNCEHYDLKAYNECHEPSADRVVDKEKANFCDFFKPNQKSASQNQTTTKPLDPKALAEALFKKK